MSEDIKKERLKQIKEKYERDKSQITLRYKAQSDAMAARKKGELERLKDRYKMSVEGVERSQNIRDGQKKPNQQYVVSVETQFCNLSLNILARFIN